MMNSAYMFQPARSPGFLFHSGFILLLSIGAFFGLWQASQAQVGPLFLLFLIPVLLAASLIPYLLYRLQGLRTSRYILERDGIRLQWGLRFVDIPMNQVLWAGTASQLTAPLPLPWLRWPGCLIGIRKLPDKSQIEFLASRSEGLIFIATPGRIYAISPSDPEAFLQTFQRYTEMGSLTPITPRSLYPNSLLFKFWADRPARYLFLAGAVFSLLLVIAVSLAIPARTHVSLQLTQAGAPVEYVPSVRLLLLPVLNTLFFAADVLAGLFFYRYKENQPLAYMLWSSGALTPLLFIGGVIFILKAG